MDPKFIERQSTIQNYEDSSATSRIELWRGALNLIKDYPLGVGAGGYEVLNPNYATEVVEVSLAMSARSTTPICLPHQSGESRVWYFFSPF